MELNINLQLITRDIILVDFIYPAFAEVMDLKDAALELEINENTVLFGDHSVLDSLDLVSFIVLVEERINETQEIDITLTSEKAMSRSSTPFRTIGTLAEFIKEILNEDKA